MHMKNKKGFTMVELMAVIVVIGIIAIIAVPIYHGNAEKMKVKSLENKVLDLESKAEGYAQDRNSTKFSIQNMIDHGYVEADNEEGKVLSPVDQSEMNCRVMVVDEENGNYNATLTEENNCDIEAESSLLYLEMTDLYGNAIDITGTDGWTRMQSVRLHAKFRSLDGYTVENYVWLVNNSKLDEGVDITTYDVTAELILNAIYQVRATLRDTEGKVTNASAFMQVKIDRQKPVMSSIYVKDREIWTAHKKQTTGNATDYNGSGIASYYLVQTNDCSDPNRTALPAELENGTYYACAIDKVGNRSDAETFIINSVDSAPTKPTITPSDGLASGTWHNGNYTLTFQSTTNGSPITYYYGTYKSVSRPSNDPVMPNTGNQVNITPAIFNTWYYVKACSQTGLCSESNSYLANKDAAPTNLTITASDGQASGTWHYNNFTLQFNSTQNGSATTYYYGTSSAYLPNRGSSISLTPATVNTTYYVRACSQSNLCTDVKSYVVNRDTTRPTATIAGDVTSYQRSITLTITLKDNESGLSGYAITRDYTVPTTWTSISGHPSSKVITYNISGNGSYYIWIKDEAGNTNYQYYYTYYIDNEGPEIDDGTITMNWCDSDSFNFNTSFTVWDAGSGYDYYQYKITTSSSRPSSGWRNQGYSYSNLDCGTTYYVWIRGYDKLGNVTYYRFPGTIRCDDCYYGDYDDGGDDDYEPSTPSKPSTGPVSYDPSHVCSNYSNGCILEGYASGKCERITSPSTSGCPGSTYKCYCCQAEDYNGIPISWNGRGSCTGG